MITAKDAREIASQSDAWLQTELRKLEPDIKKSAELNKSPCTIHLGSVATWEVLQPTNAQVRVIDALKKLGFTVKFEKYGASYVPRGLQDDDGNGPTHKNFGYIIYF